MRVVVNVRKFVRTMGAARGAMRIAAGRMALRVRATEAIVCLCGRDCESVSSKLNVVLGIDAEEGAPGCQLVMSDGGRRGREWREDLVMTELEK